jgi:AraC-like DNA-binding protein
MHVNGMMSGAFHFLLDVIRSYGAGERVPVSARWPDEAYAPNAYLRSLLRGGVTFDPGPGRLEFASAELETPHPAYNARMAEVLTRGLDRSLREVREGESTSLQVERLLENVLGRARVESLGGSVLGEVCATLGVSRWTLHRRLAEENTSLSVLLSAARTREAKRLLEETRLSIQEISELLGFASRTSFSHAFHRETGISPARCRARAQASSRS